MVITEKWLNDNIVLGDGGLQLSQKQFSLLYSWFKDDIFNEGINGNKNLKKKWNVLLIGKEITDTQAVTFSNAKYEQSKSKKVTSRIIHNQIERALQLTAYAYDGKIPAHPHKRFVSLIGHIPSVDITNVAFCIDGTTIVEFYFDGEKYNRFRAVCAGQAESMNPPTFHTELLALIPPAIYGEEEKSKLLMDCTGKDIVECINKYKKKKIIVIQKKEKTIVLKASNPEEELHKTSKQKENEYKQAVKFAKKNGMTIYPRTEIEVLRDKFIDDFNTYNKNLKKKNESEISMQEYAKLCNIDINNPLSLYEYNGAPKQ